MPGPKVAWTPLLRNQVLTLWREGKSASEIAKIMGPDFSRNMVLGQLFHTGNMRSGVGSNGLSPKKKLAVQRMRASEREYQPEYVVHEMWSMEEDKRRRAIISRAARGARETRQRQEM